jgi:hypothetical protein
MDRYQYQCSGGGPHIVIPQSQVEFWKGHEFGDDPLDPATDYGRACAISQDFDLIPVGSGRALVVANPPFVAWSPRSSTDSINLFVLQEWTDTDLDSLLDTATKDSLLKSTGKTWRIDDDLLRLHYAADDPEQPLYGRIDIPCRPDEYEILSAPYESDLGEVIVLRFQVNSK